MAYSATGELAFNSYWSNVFAALWVISLKLALLWAENCTKRLPDFCPFQPKLFYPLVALYFANAIFHSARPSTKGVIFGGGAA